MKETKNKSFKHCRFIAALLLVITILATLTACKTPEHDTEGTCTVVLGDDKETAFTVKLDDVKIEKGLLSLLDYLKKDGKLDYTCDASGFLKAVGDVKENAESGTYLYIYTSVESDYDVSEYATTKEYKGTTLTSVGVGASQMTILDGAIIYIGTIKW